MVSTLHPTISAKNLTIPLQPVSLQSCNQSSKVEKNNAEDTVVEKAPNPTTNIAEETKLRKTKLLTEKRNLLTRSAKMGGTEPEISTKPAENQSCKVEKKNTDTEEKTSNPLRKDGGTQPEISTKSAQNQHSKGEKSQITDTEEEALNS